VAQILKRPTRTPPAILPRFNNHNQSVMVRVIRIPIRIIRAIRAIRGFKNF
jgi:hypothetical protein